MEPMPTQQGADGIIITKIHGYTAFLNNWKQYIKKMPP